MSADTAIVATLCADDIAIVPNWLRTDQVRTLRHVATAADAAGAFEPARIGRAGRRVLDLEQRGDRILWLDPADPTPALAELFARLDALRLAINSATYAGLFDWEGHWAVYPPGRGYRRHLDRFQDDDRRMLSTVLYFNEDWRPKDGGHLQVWHPLASRTEAPRLEVAPEAGTLVVFWADRIPHAVARAHRERWSIAGWYRRR